MIKKTLICLTFALPLVAFGADMSGHKIVQPKEGAETQFDKVDGNKHRSNKKLIKHDCVKQADAKKLSEAGRKKFIESCERA
jgi:hypothetical protein